MEIRWNENHIMGVEELDREHRQLFAIAGKLVDRVEEQDASDSAGRLFVLREGLKYLRKAGLYLEPGNFVDCGTANINVHEICANNLRIIGMNNHTHTKYKTVMEMMLRTKDQFPWDRLFSHCYPLEETEQAIRTSMTKESMKVLINPWATV